jgi:hypothetical protein
MTRLSRFEKGFIVTPIDQRRRLMEPRADLTNHRNDMGADMIKSSSVLLLTGLMAFATSAFSDDSPSAQPVKSPEQRLQACMAKQHQKSPSLSADELKKQCAQMLQAQDNHPSVPPTPAPPAP